MEGGGEGMVAVLRGPETELAVSLLLAPVNRPRLARSEPRASQTLSDYGNTGNTGNIGNFGNTGNPAVCNEAYTSTYQVAHCGANSWSPSRCVQEFPPQRLKPSHTEGNFEVSSDNSRRLAPTHNIQSPRVRRWDRVCHLPRPHHDRDVDAFISTLRKYPSAERSPSSELLERLIKATPNPPKDSLAEPFSRSLRSLGDKQRATKDYSTPKTAKRSKREKSRSPKKGQTLVQFDVRHQNTQSCDEHPLPKGTVSVSAFDYLNSARAQSPPGTPDRRAGPSEPRTLRNAFREIYRDERGPLAAFPLCPTMQSRYERHLKQCHPSTSQVPHVDVAKLKTCNKCLQKRPCPCETAKILRRLVDKEGEEKQNLEDAILSWLKDIPVYPNENPHDKFIRDAIVKKLAENLSSIDDDEFTIKARDEINEAIDKLPMWYPRDKIDKANFRRNITDNLLDKIKSTKAEKRFKKATENFFNRINFDDAKEMDRTQALDDITKELNKIAHNRPEDDDVYRDMLKMKAFEMLDRLPIKTDLNRYDYLNQLSDELADHLMGVSPKTLDAEQKQNLIQGISDILDETNDRIRNRDKVEENLRDVVSDIVSQMMDRDKAKTYIKNILEGKVADSEIEDTTNKLLALADATQGRPQIDSETSQIIKEDLRGILDLSDFEIKNRSKVEETLHKAVADIITKGMDDDKAMTHLKTILKGKVPDNKVEDIAKQVLALAGQVTPSQAKVIDQETKQIIKEDISGILDLSETPIKNRGKVEENLRKLVADIATTGMDKDKAISHIRTILKGKVSEDKLNDIAEQVLALADQVTPVKPKMDQETKQIIKGDIHNILDLSNTPIKNRSKVEENLRNLVADIATKGMDKDKAMTHIKTILKGKVSEDKLEDIAQQVLALANEVTPSKEKAIDQESIQISKEDISDILDLSDSHIKNRSKVEESLHKAVANIVAKGMPKDKAIAHIKTILRGKVPDDKVDDIAEQVLALTDQAASSQAQTIDYETKQMIKEDISNILDISDTPIKNRSKLEENLRQVVADIAAKHMDKDKAKIQIESILKGKVPDDKLNDICKRVLALANKVEADTSMSDPKLQETIKEDISNILDQTKGHIKNRFKVEESLRNILSDLVMRGMDTDKAQDHIHSILKGNVSDSQAAEISRKILALANEMSFRSYSGGPSASSTQNADKIYFDQVYEVIREWLSNHVIGLHKNKLNEVARAIANDTVDRQKYLQLNKTVKSSQEKELEILKEQIYKALNTIIDKKSVQSVMPEVETLMRSLKEIPIPEQLSVSGIVQDSTEFVQENLEGALLDWLRGSPIYQDRNKNNRQAQEETMTRLAASLAAVLSSKAKERPGVKMDAILLKEITKHLEDLPLEPQFKSKEYIRKLGDHMLDFLKSLQLFQDISARVSIRDSQRMTSFMPSTNHLNDIVKNWCEALPLPDTDESFHVKQDLGNKIILKIGELNMNQDIFNDDLLYEEMLEDFIDQELTALQIDMNVSEARKNLIDQIKEIKQRVQDTLVGRAYRQQLRGIISNTLPSMSCPTEEDLASFELLKENLADAFINLNYSVDDEAAKAKFRRRITDEINKFVNEYMGRCPATPVNNKRLHKALQNALNKVPVPGDESMRSEVEAVRMKDLITDWLKILPLGRQTKTEQLHTNKIVTLMAQKLQELENEFNPEFSEIATEEIVKYLKKLPLRNKNNLDVMAKKLIDKITNTTESRSLIAGTSSARVSDCSLYRDPPLPYPCYTDISERPSYLSRGHIIPPCGLSSEDKKMLQQIRQRAQPCQTAAPPAKRCCKDAAINPPPLDHGSQTVMETRPSKSCQADKLEPICPNTKRLTVHQRPCASTGSQADMSPCVLVKEYYWDSTPDANMEFACPAPAQASGRACLPSAIPPPQNCMDSCGILQGPARLRRSCRESPTCRGAAMPRRQLASACPNEYIRPRPHNCGRFCPMRSSERDYLRTRPKRIEPVCSRKRQSVRTCQEDPTAFCPRCCAPCPHPTGFYFK